ncbi:glycoside hydrolase family 2 TIM barrel-domain containing protein [Alkalitalea saponilacus]|uniref:Beta-galactosidase n=1 Tax=Alkalitalea saponilacus TaxID=889453 RepID=A0A1T5EX11_9BACT|nr:glycoside hydrolase family 2 TIM barrel-domain containing protein [Alkalitalea saponilacus]ASB47987.1 glycoside hydrolase family 2 [Alkalitalea saponilacus]SKB88398.1 beta-galactosidase [Alkalitalea saponilacus]
MTTIIYKKWKNLFTLLLISIFIFSGCMVDDHDYPSSRITISFNNDWMFMEGDHDGAQARRFNDRSWRALNVPHDWSIEGEFDQNNPTGRGGGYLPNGIGWYRKSFDIPSAFEGRRVFIHFDGLMANSDVYINGEHLGHRPYGYVSMEYELTDYLRYGRSNTIAVRLDNSKQPASRWYTGAGIYRNVRLIVKNDVHIDNWGTFFSTPKVSEESATVRVFTTLKNSSEISHQVHLNTLIHNPTGDLVSEKGTVIDLAPGEKIDIEQILEVLNPQLWSLDSPQLYKGISQVTIDNELQDDLVTNFGIRSFHFEPATGFYLNGENIRIKGVCLHHDAGAVGAAVPLAIWEERFNQLQSIGINAIRLSHNPFAPEFLELCDRMGFIVMNESFDTWRARKNHGDYGYQHHFDEWWEEDTRSIVLRDRNHPSIFMFSIGNEIRDNLDNEQGFETFRMQYDLVHKLDGTRPVTMGLFRPNQANVYQNGFAEMMDIVGQNYREEELLQASIDNPHWKVIGTENGHTRQAYLIWRDNPAIAGHFLWTGFDYLGEADWPEVSHDFGLFDRAGFTKPRTYERESWWSDKPMIRIFRREQHLGEGGLVDDWTPTDFDTYDEAHIEIYTNCDEVELIFNGESQGVRKRPADHSPIRYRLTYQPGSIKAIGRIDGKDVAIHEMQTAMPPSNIALSASKTTLKNDWDDVAIVRVMLTDENGVHSPNFDRPLTFNVSGNGELIAVDNGQRDSHEPFKTNVRRTSRGQAIAIVRANADVGQILVSVSGEGLEESSIEININQ